MSTSVSNVTADLHAVNGIDLYCEVEGDGPPLLLLHGFTGSGADWSHAGRDELARGRRLVVPDLRGHGRTNNPARTIAHRQCALDVLALLDRLGIERCQAIGLSMGGNTLLHLATNAPERVDAMVVVSATMYFPAQARAIMGLTDADGHSDEEWQAMRARHHLGDEQIRALWAQQYAWKDDVDDLCFTPPKLATIRARTLVVYGDRDPLYPVDMAVDLYRAIPRASLWVVPEGGHGPIFGEARAAFVQTAREFLARS
jgi:pimeloyl-ACP methyl ester carboxylesterase